jgi:hypothetical protein
LRPIFSPTEAYFPLENVVSRLRMGSGRSHIAAAALPEMRIVFLRAVCGAKKPLDERGRWLMLSQETIATLATGIIIGFGQALNWLRSKKNADGIKDVAEKVVQVHVLINSGLDRRLDERGDASFAAGRKAEVDERKNIDSEIAARKVESDNAETLATAKRTKNSADKLADQGPK